MKREGNLSANVLVSFDSVSLMMIIDDVIAVLVFVTLHGSSCVSKITLLTNENVQLNEKCTLLTFEKSLFHHDLELFNYQSKFHPSI